MRILFINALFEPFGGGAERTIKELAKLVNGLGHEVKILTLWDKEDEEVEIDGLKIYRAKIPNLYFPDGRSRPPLIKRRLWHIIEIYNPLAKRIVSRQIDIFTPHIIQIHNTYGWSSSVYDAVLESGVPGIQVIHDLHLLCPTNMFKKNSVCKKQCFICKLIRFPQKVKTNKLKAVVGLSQFVLKKFLDEGYFTKVPIRRVLYRPIALKKCSFVRKADNNSVNFGFIGSLYPYKGVELLLKSFRKVKRANFRLYIAGRGFNDYEIYLKSKYADESVIFMGEVSPEIFLEKVDVVVVPSLGHDTFPRVVLESLSCGIPVIGSNLGGIPEMIIDGVNGIIFDPYKIGDLEEKILMFASKIKDWRSRCSVIRNSVSNFLDFERWANEWTDLYNSVLNL